MGLFDKAKEALAEAQASVKDLTSKMSDLSIPVLAGAPAKVPLADRKKIRDDWDSKIPELEQKFGALLGEPFKIHVDVNGLYGYIQASESSAKSNVGLSIWSYFNGALNHLTHFKAARAADVPAIAQYASTKTITLEPTNDAAVNYVGTDFKDGRWRILFKEGRYGINAQDAANNLGEALNNASKAGGAAGGLSLTAKQGVRDAYEAKIGAVLTKAQTLLKEPSLSFEPNFDSNYAALSAFAAGPDGSKLRKDWEKTFGPATFDYLNGFVTKLEWQNFGKDEMMREAFNEEVSTHKVSFVVSSEVTASRNDCTIKDGVLLVRTKPEAWWSNVNDACNGLDKLF